MKNCWCLFFHEVSLQSLQTHSCSQTNFRHILSSYFWTSILCDISFFSFFFSIYFLFWKYFLPWGGAHWNCKSGSVCPPAGCQERWHHRWLKLCGILMGMIWKIRMAVFPFEKILCKPPRRPPPPIYFKDDRWCKPLFSTARTINQPRAAQSTSTNSGRPAQPEASSSVVAKLRDWSPPALLNQVLSSPPRGSRESPPRGGRDPADNPPSF